MASLEGKKIKDTYKSLLKVSDNGELEVTDQEITDGAGNGTGVSLNTSGDVTATGTVAFGSLKDTGEDITISKFVDEADGIGNNDNDSSIPTSAAVKNYVDTNVTAQDLDITDGTNNGSVDLDSQSLTFTGDAGVSATVSGQTLTLDSSALQSQIDSNDSDITALQAADATLQSNIDAEEAARIAADDALDTLISDEETARIAADNTLQTNIDNEESARITADSSLQTQITANDGDITALQAEDVTLQANIDSEASTRATADTALQNQISSNDTDIANLQSADTTLQNNIDAEASARASADTTLQGNIDSEETARIAADSALQSQIDSNDTDISGLDTRLTTAEGNITSNDSDIADLDTRLNTAEVNIFDNHTDISALESGKQDISEKGQANGYASLDSGAKIPVSQLPDSIVGQVEYQGTWNASTDTPSLPSATGVKGHYYVVSTGGTYETITYAVGDWVISNGTAWEKVDNTDAVTTVFGRLGAIVANESDYSAFYPLISDLNTTNTNVNTNAANIASNDSDISALDGRLTTAEGDITAIEAKTDNITVTQAVDLDTMESDIATNASNISSNDTDIANLQSDKYDKTGGTISGSVTVTGDLDATNLGGTLSTAAQTNITSVGTLSSLAVSGDLTVDTSTLKVDSTNNRVGINESNPDVPLKVVGNGNSDVNVLTIGNFEQDDSGDETANIKFELTRSYTNTLNPAGYIKVGKERAWDSSGGRQSFMSFYTRNGTADPAEAMRIDSSGNVGIGVTSPYTGAISGRKVLDIGGTSDALLAFTTGGTARSYLYQSGTDFTIMNLSTAGGDLILANNGSERMRITSGGYLKASNDGSYISAGADWHEFTAGGTTWTQRNKNDSANPYGLTVDFSAAAPNNTTNIFLSCADNLFSRAQIYSNGTFGSRTDVYGPIVSDQRLKENIEDTTPKLDKLMQVKIKNFNLIGDDLKQIGVIAQEVEEVFPSLVYQRPEIIDVEVEDEDGNIKVEKQETGEVYKSVKSSVFTYILIKSLQEQQEIINDLKARIETLENK